MAKEPGYAKISIKREIYERLRSIAESRGLTMSEVIAQLLEYADLSSRVEGVLAAIKSTVEEIHTAISSMELERSPDTADTIGGCGDPSVYKLVRYIYEGTESKGHFIARLAVLFRLFKQRYSRVQVNKILYGKYIVDVYGFSREGPTIIEIVLNPGKSLIEKLHNLARHRFGKGGRYRLVVVTSRNIKRQWLEQISGLAEVWFLEDIASELAREAIEVARGVYE